MSDLTALIGACHRDAPYQIARAPVDDVEQKFVVRLPPSLGDVIRKRFNESQPRDDQGQWTSGGGASGGMGGETNGLGFTGSQMASLKVDERVFWHGSPSGDLRGSYYGLHVGTYLAAKQALEARIGAPAAGEWDGTREYGSTLVRSSGAGYGAGERGKNKPHFPSGDAVYSDGSKIPLTVRPSIAPYEIIATMTNSRETPHSDARANGLMAGQIARGRARRGYYYVNEGEGESDGISAVVPNGSHLRRITPENIGRIGEKTLESDYVEFKVFDENQPRNADGEWTSTGGEPRHVNADVGTDQEIQNGERLAVATGHRSTVDAELRSLGAEDVRVTFSAIEPKVIEELGKGSFSAASYYGDYDTKTGKFDHEIVVNMKWPMRRDDLLAIVRHEVEHAKFRVADMNTDIASKYLSPRGKLLKPLRDEGNLVSGYASAWWDRAEKQLGPYGGKFEYRLEAMNESLAEFAAFRGKRGVEIATARFPTHAKLYDEVETLWAARKKSIDVPANELTLLDGGGFAAEWRPGIIRIVYPDGHVVYAVKAAVDKKAGVVYVDKVFNESQPRDDQGQWTSGGGAVRGLPADVSLDSPSLESLRDGLKRGAFDISVEKTRTGYGETIHTLKIVPNDIPRSWKTTERGDSYDPTYCEVDGEFGRVRAKKEGLFDYPKDFAEPGHLYRGMSYEEYRAARARGYLTSEGKYNLGDEQVGVTFYSNDMEQAAHYASGFAPWQYKATVSRPAVIVKIKDPGDHAATPSLGSHTSEVGLRGRIPFSSIVGARFGHPVSVTPGDMEIVQDRWGGKDTFKMGSASGLSVSVRWDDKEKTKSVVYLQKYSDGQARVPAGDPNGGQFAGAGAAMSSADFTRTDGDRRLPMRLQPGELQAGDSPAAQNMTKLSQLIDDAGSMDKWTPSVQAKRDVSNNLAQRLEKNKEWRAFQELVYWQGEEPLRPGESGGDYDRSQASYFVSQWAQSSSDDHPSSLFMQAMAKEEFGLKGVREAIKNSRFVALENSTLDSLTDRVLTTFGVPVNMSQHREIVQNGARAFLRAMYDETQTDLARNGIKEVFVTRGTRQTHLMQGVHNVRMHPMSSFSSNVAMAAIFGGEKGALIFSKVPASRVLSTPRTGYGCLKEHEVVVLGGRGLRSVVISPAGLAAINSGKWETQVAEELRAVHKALADDGQLDLDDTLVDADWTKTTWDLPPYKSAEFNELVPDLDAFRKLPVYISAVETGLIINDEWRGEKKSGVVYVEKFDENQPRDDHGRWSTTGAAGGAAKPEPSTPSSFSDTSQVDLFHGTSEEAVDSIIKNGLLVKPDKRNPLWEEFGYYVGERGNSVYVTENHDKAVSYAEIASGKGAPAVLHFKVPRSVANTFIPDEEDNGRSFRAPGKIDSKYLTEYELFYYERGNVRSTTHAVVKGNEDLVDLYAVIVCVSPSKSGVVYVEKFDESQPRDDHGRWSTTGAAGGAAKPEPSTPSSFADPAPSWSVDLPLPGSGRPIDMERAVLENDLEGTYNFLLQRMRRDGIDMPEKSGKFLDPSVPHSVDDYRAQLGKIDDNPMLALLVHDAGETEQEMHAQRDAQLVSMVNEMGFSDRAVARFARLESEWEGNWDHPGGRALRAVYDQILGGDVYSGNGKLLPKEEANKLFAQAAKGVGATELVNVFKADMAYQQEKLKRALTTPHSDVYGRKVSPSVPDDMSARGFRTIKADAKGLFVYRGVVVRDSELDGLLKEKSFSFGAASATTLSEGAASKFALGWSMTVSRQRTGERDVDSVATTNMELRSGEAGAIIKVKVPWNRVASSFVGGTGSPAVSEIRVLGNADTMKGEVVGYYRGPLSSSPSQVIKPTRLK